ncbi:terminase large subunit [Novosphingobium sp. JCM 18896]|uniref:terminase large subunit n=1 Tax=Novosphingobium sp. JCM 18896 TaxID=2989731 RepID=UPI002222A84F|nr:terminase TerL endonuclease subunit [Novosphingobium sp. JCM 18896]MCW1431388.1 terminase large subunit [Novosphingobium sp. JCM 18896]
MRFVETMCRVPEGPLVGQPVRLADFQEAFFYAIYDNEVVTKKALLSIARKNSKTATISMIVLVHTVGPEAKLNSRINSGGRSRKQAAEVYNYASKMVQLSPKLRQYCRLIPSNKKIIGLPMNVEYEALSAEGSTTHGGSPIVAIVDEAGQIKGPQDDFWDALTTGQGAYDDALLIVISTQAPTDADLFSIELDNAERSQNPSTVSHVYAAPEDCELDDESAWEAANPAMGLFRSRNDVEEHARGAKEMPSNEPTFRVLYLNQRINMVSAFVSASVWKQGNETPGALEGVVYGGLDLSATTDLTALVLTSRVDGLLHVHPTFWMPEDSVMEAKKRDKAPYDVWVKQGLLRTTPGKVIDYDFVARDIGQITAGLNIAKIGFDRWRMDRMKGALERQGVELPLEPFGQGYVSMSPALDALEADLLNGVVRHGGHPVLAMCAANAVAVPDPAGNRKLDKSKATGRIDGLVALTMAEGVEAMHAETDVSVDDWLKSFAA